MARSARRYAACPRSISRSSWSGRITRPSSRMRCASSTTCSAISSPMRRNRCRAPPMQRCASGRSGLGVMGLHSFLQGMGVPFESVMAKVWNRRMFQHVKRGADAASQKLGERAWCLPGRGRLRHHGAVLQQDRDRTDRFDLDHLRRHLAGDRAACRPTLITHKTLSGSFAGAQHRIWRRCWPNVAATTRRRGRRS